jgi:methylated-DNA-[protein]-cysteine S-methyltransferase
MREAAAKKRRFPLWKGYVGATGNMMLRSIESSHTKYFWKTIASPVGSLKLIASDRGLAVLVWDDEKDHRVPRLAATPSDDHPILIEAERQLAEYFAGTRTSFTVPLDFAGTEFQREVWQALLTIPYGQTRSYGQIARQIGKPDAVRAVGAANGRNPISIIAPCHRVIGSTGKLVGFGGGLPVKAQLLAHEGGAFAGFAL